VDFFGFSVQKGKFLAAEKFALLPVFLKRQAQEARHAVLPSFLFVDCSIGDEPLLKTE